jgi:hypothetical protein
MWKADVLCTLYFWLHYDYCQLYNHFGDIIIDFLVAKDIIPFSVELGVKNSYKIYNTLSR